MSIPPLSGANGTNLLINAVPEKVPQLMLPNSSSSLPADDIIAGTALLFAAFLGIFLHVTEMLTMYKLLKDVIGFRFFLILSFADLNMLLLFGIIPGAAIFVSSLLVPLTAWKYSMHIWADTVWFAGCYMNLLIAITRFACVVFPLQFRMLRRQCTCWLIGLAIWAIALAQSLATNSASWFVAIWYTAGIYGMDCDWSAYAKSGTLTYYVTLNSLIIVAYLLIYISTAVIIFTKKAVRLRFFKAILKAKSSSNDGQVANGQQQKNNGQIANEPKRLSVAVGVVGLHPKNSRVALQQRSLSNNNLLIRTVNIVRSVRKSESTTSQYSMEMRLVIPCCVNALIFIIGQIFIMNGGIGPQGKWADLSVMLIFCLQSIAPPILRLIFSKVLRHHFMAHLRMKRPANNGTPPPMGAGIALKRIGMKNVPITPQKY
ncbi:hypothetical protein niasHT_009548 [Heterodera trifolii]|uniref:Uncharacterized protein n=1 Tax=Heterodera trifolii TaxID=157864 RepID=A0ABD2M5E1_9BILA